MKVPISWLKDFVDIVLPIEELAHRLTMAGLEVEEIRYVGLALPDERSSGSEQTAAQYETKITGLAWDPETIVVGAVLEVMPHPNADRLVLCRLDDGVQEHTVLTGAPNLFTYKGRGPLETPLKVAYAREGARIYDGHQPGQQLMTLKRARIRGVESYSMACSEKELGISEEHEGIILLDSDAPAGVPLADYMGDAVLDIAITPNLARNANIYGVAREVAALTGAPLRPMPVELEAEGPPIEGRVAIEIQEPELNPRFVLGLLENITIQPSPYSIQRRLRLAGIRPINNIVDATNYVMIELGEPLHAFDYDILVQRAGANSPTIITRRATPGEKLTTLDGEERKLDDFTVLVCDTAGSLSIAGVMGGAESEVNENTKNVLLEGAAWDFINVRRTAQSQNLHSEASYRFSRGVHPAMAEYGVKRGLEMMRRLSGGVVARGLVDAYPSPPVPPVVKITPADARRWLGLDLTAAEMTDLLSRLAFTMAADGDNLSVTPPDHRLDIGSGVIGMADLMEEIARIYGYDRIPETRMADSLPPQRGNPQIEREDRIRDLLVTLGLQEVITYRLTTQEREARLLPAGSPADDRPYLGLKNPISADRAFMRHSVLSSLLEIMEQNARRRDRIMLFEIGPVFFASEAGPLPEEHLRLVLAMSGARMPASWQEGGDESAMDFYDLKGIVEELLHGLNLGDVSFRDSSHASFHPGKRARVVVEGRQIGVLGELHPLVHANYDLMDAPVLAADLDLAVLYELLPERFDVVPLPLYPPVLEDLAIIVDDRLSAEEVEEVIRKAGGALITRMRLFDVYRGDQVGEGNKSLAYSIEYQAPDRTLTDQDVLKIRQRIEHHLKESLNASIRSA